MCVAICNILNDLYNKVFIPNKLEDLNPSAFKMIKRINKSKALTKHISCECKYKFGGITINVNVSGKTIIYVKKIMFGILLHVIVKIENI